MTAYANHIRDDETESLLQDTYAPELPISPRTQLKYRDVLNLLGVNVKNDELWGWLRERGVRVCGTRQNYVSYGDLVKAGLVK